jgi:Cu+-exporting ATPase
LQAYVGRRFYVNAYKGLRHGNYGMDLLVALGTSTAYGYSLLALVYACGWPHPASMPSEDTVRACMHACMRGVE